jgi:hypothetical protein
MVFKSFLGRIFRKKPEPNEVVESPGYEVIKDVDELLKKENLGYIKRVEITEEGIIIEGHIKLTLEVLQQLLGKGKKLPGKNQENST